MTLRDAIERLEREKSQQYPATLAKIWRTDEGAAVGMADQLVEVGFFERRGTKDEPAYWVPFLYRDALNLVQGSADPGRSTDEMDAADDAQLANESLF